MRNHKQTKIVRTISGEDLDIALCRKYEKGYYKIGNSAIKGSGDCYHIEGKMYRNDTGNIFYNHSINRYVLGSINLMIAVVSFSPLTGEAVLGHVNTATYDILLSKDSRLYPVDCEEELFKNKFYREELSSGIFYSIYELQASRFGILRHPDNSYKTSLPYDSKGLTGKPEDIFREKFKDEISFGCAEYSKILKGLTFGFEFETVVGFMPKRITDKYGLIPLRDGSIGGIEYATIPMSGAMGMQAVVNSMKEFKLRTDFDNTCSMHLHIGNVPRTKEFILAFAKFMLAFQDDMFAMFPLVKKYNFKLKNKNYSAPFPTYQILSELDPVIDANNINKNFDILFTYLSGGEPFNSYHNDLKNVKSHPHDPDSNQKWNIKSRYHIVNLVPLIFGNKQTIEFRIHTPTFDERKIMDFLIMNACIVNYVIKNQDNILRGKHYLTQIKLRGIILHEIESCSKYSNSLCTHIDQYIKNRINSIELQCRDGNIMGTEENIQCGSGINWYTKEEPLVNGDMKFTKTLEESQDHYSKILAAAKEKADRQLYEKKKMETARRRMKTTASMPENWKPTAYGTPGGESQQFYSYDAADMEKTLYDTLEALAGKQPSQGSQTSQTTSSGPTIGKGIFEQIKDAGKPSGMPDGMHVDPVTGGKILHHINSEGMVTFSSADDDWDMLYSNLADNNFKKSNTEKDGSSS